MERITEEEERVKESRMTYKPKERKKKGVK